MSSSKYKYLAVMATETGQQEEWKAENKEEEGASIIVDYKMEGYYYGAPEPVSRPNNYRDRLLLATACCCCCGLAAAKCSQDVNNKLRAGDMEGAKVASEKTLDYTNKAVLTGLFLSVILVVLLAMGLLLLLFFAIDAPQGFY